MFHYLNLSCSAKASVTNIEIFFFQLNYSPLTTILFSALAASLVSTVIMMVVCRFQTKKAYGIYLICLYLCFVTIAVLKETNVFWAQMNCIRTVFKPNISKVWFLMSFKYFKIRIWLKCIANVYIGPSHFEDT